MKCVYCANETQVINSRAQAKANQVWRRRCCSNCKNVFTTLEAADLSAALRFKNHQGHLEPFWRDKLLISIYDSLRHRKNAYSAASALTQTTLNKLQKHFNDAIVDRATLVEVVHQTIKRYDRGAAAVYQAYRQN